MTATEIFRKVMPGLMGARGRRGRQRWGASGGHRRAPAAGLADASSGAPDPSKRMLSGSL